MLFRAFDPGVRVSAETVLSVISGMHRYQDQAIQILRQNGINESTKDKWYSQQNWLNAFAEIAVLYGDEMLFDIGTNIFKKSKWPDSLKDMHDALASINVAYHMNHSPGNIGNYNYTKTGDTAGTMVCDNPYPDAFDKGIIQGTIAHFGNMDLEECSVEIDTTKEQRSLGALSTTFALKW